MGGAREPSPEMSQFCCTDLGPLVLVAHVGYEAAMPALRDRLPRAATATRGGIFILFLYPLAALPLSFGFVFCPLRGLSTLPS